MTAALRRSVSSLSVPNYRRYFVGQVISVSGNWMQLVAQMWLIVQLTGSGVAVGLTAGLQFAPILVLGAWGGLVADRFPKRRVLMITQPLMALPAIELGVLARATARQQLASRGRERDERRAPVLRVAGALDEPALLEARDDARDRRALDALAGRELAGSQRTVAVDGGQRGGLRRAELLARLLTQPASGARDREAKPDGEIGLCGRTHC